MPAWNKFFLLSVKNSRYGRGLTLQPASEHEDRSQKVNTEWLCTAAALYGQLDTEILYTAQL